MHPLVKLFLIIASFFASTFIIIRLSGVLTVDDVKQWLTNAQQASPITVSLIIFTLLFADLFIAMPTLTIIILSGFFLGFSGGFWAAFCGVFMAGTCGYVLSRQFGERFLEFLVKDKKQQRKVKDSFHQYGTVMILLSRALPILPETSACLAGIAKMPFIRFITYWLLSSVPYLLIATYAGSISSFENPKPAIYVAIGLSGTLWLGWWVYTQIPKRSR